MTPKQLMEALADSQLEANEITDLPMIVGLPGGEAAAVVDGYVQRIANIHRIILQVATAEDLGLIHYTEADGSSPLKHE